MIKITQEKGQLPQAVSERKAEILVWKSEEKKKGVGKWIYKNDHLIKKMSNRYNCPISARLYSSSR